MMKKALLCCLGLFLIFGIGAMMTNNTIMHTENVTLADGTTLAIPTEFTVKTPFSNTTESDGFYHTNCELESKDYGTVFIEYTNDPVETMTHGSNSTKATDNNGIYEFDVFDANGHKVMKIRGSNPAVVESIGKSVKL